MGKNPIILGNHAYLCPFVTQKIVKWTWAKMGLPPSIREHSQMTSSKICIPPSVTMVHFSPTPCSLHGVSFHQPLRSFQIFPSENMIIVAHKIETPKSNHVSAFNQINILNNNCL